ncbi:MAG: hypothetical protein J6Y07_02415 [Alphaproteobacteria bacterium]|nr:hypothetical protein [Alphaproteobacteria bacterium]
MLWQEFVDDVKCLAEDCAFIHSCFSDVRAKRRNVRAVRRNGGPDYEEALRRLEISKAWRRVHLRHILGLEK